MTTIRFVVCEETPHAFMHWKGRETQQWSDHLVPAAGFEGTFQGVPGRMLEGNRWEIRPIDMRDNVARWLDEAEDLLQDELRAGETMDRIFRAQRLILLAQLQTARRAAGGA